MTAGEKSAAEAADSKTIARAEIETLVPHAGAMCLIDEVVEWTEDRIHARAVNHRETTHPLAENGRLSSMHLIEYGAQATAIHGSLGARASGATAATARPGMIVSVRDVRLHVDRLDTLPGALEIHAKRLLATAGGHLYEFEIESGLQVLAQGRIAVMLGARQ